MVGSEVMLGLSVLNGGRADGLPNGTELGSAKLLGSDRGCSGENMLGLSPVPMPQLGTGKKGGSASGDLLSLCAALVPGLAGGAAPPKLNIAGAVLVSDAAVELFAVTPKLVCAGAKASVC